MTQVGLPSASTDAPIVPSMRARLAPLSRATGVIVLASACYLLPEALGGSLRIYDTLVVIAIFGVMAYGVDLMLSYLGEVSLGHTVFWAGSAYVAAVLSIRYELGGWTTLLLGVAFALVVAAVLGLAVLRARSFIFSLSTYAAAVVALNVAHNWEFLGGSDGLVGLPYLDLGLFGATLEFRTVRDLWPVAFGMVLVVVALVHRFRNSRLAQNALMAQMNPDLAATLGVDVNRIRLLLLILSAVPPALAGWLYAYYRSYVSSDLFEMYFLILMLTAAVLVGRRLLLGPLLGIALIVSQQNLADAGGDGNRIILGAALVLVLVIWPSGLVGLWRVARGMLHRRLTSARRAVGPAVVPGAVNVASAATEEEVGHG